MSKFYRADIVCFKHNKEQKGVVVVDEYEGMVGVHFCGEQFAMEVEAKLIEISAPKPISTSSGGSVDYYTLPKDSTELMDLIEHKDMNCAISNIFKAAYRYGQKHHSSQKRDLEKIIYFATRELNRISKET